jgi:hypothetical protein
VINIGGTFDDFMAKYLLFSIKPMLQSLFSKLHTYFGPTKS